MSAPARISTCCRQIRNTVVQPVLETFGLGVRKWRGQTD